MHPNPPALTSLFLEPSIQGLIHPIYLLQPQKAAPLSIGTKLQNHLNEQLWLIVVSKVCLSNSSSICPPLLRKALPSFNSCFLYLFHEMVLPIGRKILVEHFHLLFCLKKRKSSHSVNLDRGVPQEDPMNPPSAAQQGIHCVISCSC